MGTITSSIGLVSGLDTQSLVTQLMAIESQSLTLIQNRIAATTEQQTAYMTINARIQAITASLSALTKPATFMAMNAQSSNESVLTASAGSSTPLGTSSFTVRSLVTTNQLVSHGFTDWDTTPVGAGVLTFESSEANVAPSTLLSELNGGEGVRRGTIRIIDASGGTADIDLSAAVTLDDVLEAINGQKSANVSARVSGDSLIIRDGSGGTSSALTVMDVGGGYAAADLGIAGLSTEGLIQGGDLVILSESTLLAELNDGVGVRHDSGLADFQFNLADGTSFDVNLTDSLTFDTHLDQLNSGFGVRLGTIRVTNRAGESAEIDLSGAQTIQDVKTALADADIGVTVSAISGSKLVIMDSTGSEFTHLKIEDVTGYAAADLGIAQEAESASFSGAEVYRIESLGDVMRAIEYAAGNDGKLSVEIAGNGIRLIDHTATGGGTTEVVALNGSLALADLGLEGGFDSQGQTDSRDLLAGLNTVLLSSLNGGQGLAGGPISFTLRDGSTVDLDLSGATCLSEIVQAINQQDGLSAEVDAGGTRIGVRDLTTGTAAFQASGALADALQLTGSGTAGEMVSGDLQLRYVAENTALEDLHSGEGIAFGELRITNADGTSKLLILNENLHKTVGDVIDAINALDMGVTARINDSGDGIALEDTTGGSGVLSVAEVDGGTMAADLGLLGQADTGGVLAGSLAARIELSASDTLQDLIDKINESGAPVTASVINDGTEGRPYRLILTSQTSGTKGQILFSSDIPALSLDTLTEAQDATVLVGDPSSASAVVVTSSSNTITDIVPGLTLNLLGTSDQPVQVTVARDVESVVSGVQDFISSFNAAMDQIDDLTRYIPDTESKAVLQGDSTARQVQNRLLNAVSSVFSEDDATYVLLSQLGIMVDSSSGSARLTLGRTMSNGMVIDGEAKLREALEENPEAVKDLFTLIEEDDEGESVNVGLALRIKDALESLTDSVDGLLTRANNQLADKVTQFEKQADNMEALLAGKEEQLYAQFNAMELALANLQSQQTALDSLSSLAASM